MDVASRRNDSQGPRRRLGLDRHISVGVAIAGTSLIAVPPIVPPPLPDVHVRVVRLTSGDTADSPLGDGTAFVIGGSAMPHPPQSYADVVDTLYLQPRGFTGTAQPFDTPEGLYPFTGAQTLKYNTSVAQGEQILDNAILNKIAGGQVDAANPVVVFGYSQSAGIGSLVQEELASQGVPSDDVHFVLIGDPNNPNGGVLARFDIPGAANPPYSHPTLPSLGITSSGGAPSDLYPTDIFTHEYDGAADFPRYPLNLLADLNAALGFVFEHSTYLGLTPEQIQNAIELPTSAADTMTNYYMIPVENLPLLDPLRLIPVVGNPLADLLQPDLTVLVNLGYGDIGGTTDGLITGGWDPGPADVPTPIGLWPTNINPTDLMQALVNGAQQGLTDAVDDLENPANYQIMTSTLDLPWVSQLLGTAYAFGAIDTPNPSLSQLVEDIPQALKAGVGFLANLYPISDATLLSSPTDVINDLADTITADVSALRPVIDEVNDLLTAVPVMVTNLITSDAGHPLTAIGDVIGAALPLVPLFLLGGLGADIGVAGLGTLVNFADLFGADLAP